MKTSKLTPIGDFWNAALANQKNYSVLRILCLAHGHDFESVKFAVRKEERHLISDHALSDYYKRYLSRHAPYNES